MHRNCHPFPPISWQQIFPEDISRLVHPGFAAVLKPLTDRIAGLFNGVVNDKLSQVQLIKWQEAFRFVQGHEAWSVHRV